MNGRLDKNRMVQALRPPRSITAVRLMQARWVLVLATSYLVWFSEQAKPASWLVAAYVAAYLASAPLLHALWNRSASRSAWETRIVLFDVTMVSLGLLLAGSATDFYPIFFFALFLAAIALDWRAAVAAATLLGVIHLARLASVGDQPLWFHPKHLLRLPFLLAAALFFGLVSSHQRKRAHRLQQQQHRRAVLQTLAAAAHDLRSPLTNVASFTDLLLAGDAGELSPDQRDLVERIQTDIWRVLQRASNLLDAARLGSGLFALARGNHDLLVITRNTVAELASWARIHGVALAVDNQARDTTAEVDEFQFGRVLANLLDNAIKHSPRGSQVGVRLWNPDPDSIGVEVCDQGPGIPVEQQKRLFQPYLAAGRVRSKQSSGLGLYIAHGITKAHGGTIVVDSSPQRGTCVRVVIPRATAARQPA